MPVLRGVHRRLPDGLPDGQVGKMVWRARQGCREQVCNVPETLQDKLAHKGRKNHFGRNGCAEQGKRDMPAWKVCAPPDNKRAYEVAQGGCQAWQGAGSRES